MWRLFRSNRTLHMGFILYRLKRDFGFTDWDCANLTGIPAKKVGHFLEAIHAIMRSNVLKELAKMDFEEEEQGWRARPYRGGYQAQGYFIPKTDEWYAKHKTKRQLPAFSLGAESEAEMLKILEKYGLTNNTNKKPKRNEVSDNG